MILAVFLTRPRNGWILSEKVSDFIPDVSEAGLVQLFRFSVQHNMMSIFNPVISSIEVFDILVVFHQYSHQEYAVVKIKQSHRYADCLLLIPKHNAVFVPVDFVQGLFPSLASGFFHTIRIQHRLETGNVTVAGSAGDADHDMDVVIRN